MSPFLSIGKIVISTVIAGLGLSLSQINFPPALSKTHLAKLKDGDSLTYYQCTIISCSSGKELNMDSLMGVKKPIDLCTSTLKVVVKRSGNKYRARTYTSSYIEHPNKKYAYLKLVEKSYWHFSLRSDTLLSDQSVLRLAQLELKLRPITEYDFVVRNDNGPQLIINGKKVSDQRIIETRQFIQEFAPELK